MNWLDVSTLDHATMAKPVSDPVKFSFCGIRGHEEVDCRKKAKSSIVLHITCPLQRARVVHCSVLIASSLGMWRGSAQRSRRML